MQGWAQLGADKKNSRQRCRLGMCLVFACTGHECHAYGCRAWFVAQQQHLHQSLCSHMTDCSYVLRGMRHLPSLCCAFPGFLHGPQNRVAAVNLLCLM